jgi:hypothetical protein
MVLPAQQNLQTLRSPQLTSGEKDALQQRLSQGRKFPASDMQGDVMVQHPSFRG